MGVECREKETRVRSLRDGNAILRLGCGGPDRDQLPWARFVEPEQIRSPGGRIPEIPGYDPEDLDWSWGVCTLKRDAETVLAYWLADPDGGGGRGEVVPASNVIRMKANVDRTIKFGVPDFYPLEQPLQEALGILSNCGATAREQSGVAWIQKYANATPDQIRTFLAQGREAYAQPGAGVPAQAAGSSAGSHHFTVKMYGTTRVIHADANRQYKLGDASRTSAMLRGRRLRTSDGWIAGFQRDVVDEWIAIQKTEDRFWWRPLGLQQAAALCGVSRNWLHIQASAGGVPGVVRGEGGKIASYRRAEIEDWASRGCPGLVKRAGRTKRNKRASDYTRGVAFCFSAALLVGTGGGRVGVFTPRVLPKGPETPSRGSSRVISSGVPYPSLIRPD
jgi:hypothetical protein